MIFQSTHEKQVLRQQMSVEDMLDNLRKEHIKTWFDLGLFIDRIRAKPPKADFSGSFNDYIKHVEHGGIGMVSFYFTIDGITVEANKYNHVLKHILPNAKIHYIGGRIKNETTNLIDSPYQKEIKEMDGFDNWPLYHRFFNEKLERGSDSYNKLITDFWEDTLLIVKKLGDYIENNHINLLYAINVCSNPGNISLTLAIVLISEFLGIPVINNNHDFYWEGGNREIDIKTKGMKPGPRDFFFTNAHIGEFFSVIEMLFPWERKTWMTVNINQIQCDHNIKQNGHNPANIAKIGTTVNIQPHYNISKRDIISVFKQVATIFANGKETVTVHAASKHIESDRSKYPILLGHSRIPNFDFVSNNIVFLQPTRVISRKSIELNFELINKLILQEQFCQKFYNNPGLKITLLVSGPIPLGQKDYYQKVVSDFSLFLENLPKTFKSKIFLGFLFSVFDTTIYKEQFDNPIDIWHLYHISSLILLPSQAEGRGLPILEAAASGTPILCRQYTPRKVYKEVIGTNLEDVDKLRVLEFKKKSFSKKLLNKIIDHVFFPQKNIENTTHNINVIKNRFSYEVLEKNIKDIIETLVFQLQSNSQKTEELQRVSELFANYKKIHHYDHEDLNAIMNTKTRSYLPGFGKLNFMIYLKSLIDPSFFRVEEQEIKGRIFQYAQKIENAQKAYSNASKKRIIQYYNLVTAIFQVQVEDFEIQHDHSIAYRHRNKKRYAYMDYTLQELIGLINMIHYSVFRPVKNSQPIISPQFFKDWQLAIQQLTNSKILEIDDRNQLTKMLSKNVAFGYFPNKYIKQELEYFILHPFKTKLGIELDDVITENLINSKKAKLKPAYIFIPFPYSYTELSNTDIKKYVESEIDPELTLLFTHGLIKIVKTQQWCNGIHFAQMGSEALAALRNIKIQQGFIITSGEDAAMMTDIINIDHFHIGKINDPIASKIMGVSLKSGFIQFVPAGVRTTLAYPTPIQTARDFHLAITSNLFKKLTKKIGEDKLFKLISKDAENNGTPINQFLKQLDKTEQTKKSGKPTAITHQYLNGVYQDELPWGGVMAITNTNKNDWLFKSYIAHKEPKNVPDLLNEYFENSDSKDTISLAWNGGYILNPELVGKLGLPETYIGSPLGLLVLNGEVKCPPLFNKPAFIIYKNGKIDIKKVNCKSGFTVQTQKESIVFESNGYNTILNDKPCFFDLNYKNEHIETNKHVVIRLSGNTIKEVITTDSKKPIDVIPVGLTLCIPKHLFTENTFSVEKTLDIQLTEDDNLPVSWSQISYAIEAGPMLLENGKLAINMEVEGWQSTNSIKTQAARLDYTDMRGPKIAVGINNTGELRVLAINGRIRESVGATHYDMANILKAHGMTTAMGFDPGGSSTLYVNGNIVNISPYNKAYESDIYSLPPEPRFVSNIIMGSL